MSISTAMQTGVSGLRANSTAVGKISDNIANARTDGYKRSFADLVTTTATSAASASAPASVRAVLRSDVGTEGALKTTETNTDLAITGNGFFVVSKNPNETVESNFMLTRAGSFRLDADGNLRNAAGFYLAGYPYDQGGALPLVDRNSFGDLRTINLGQALMTGSATSEMSVKGNLPAQESGRATPSDPFLSSAEYFSPLGAAERLQFSWQPTNVSNRWDLTMADSGGSQYGSVTVDFNDSGALAGSPGTYSGVTSLATAPAAFSFDTATGTATLTVDNGTTPQTLTVELGEPCSFDGMTQFSGDYTPLDITADGAETGMLTRSEISDNGDVYGVFDNGNRMTLFSIPVADVRNPNGLIPSNGNAYLLSQNSGALRIGTAGEGSVGSIVPGALESSNVEIAQELTDLIATQRAYSTNAKIVTTVDEMLDETTRLKR